MNDLLIYRVSTNYSPYSEHQIPLLHDIHQNSLTLSCLIKLISLLIIMSNTTTNPRKHTHSVTVEADLEAPFTSISSNTRLKKSIKKLSNSSPMHTESCKYRTTVFH